MGVVTGKLELLQPPVDNMDGVWTDYEEEAVSQMIACSFFGSPETIKEDMESFIKQTGVDEVMVTSHIFDHQARVHSYQLFAELMKG